MQPVPPVQRSDDDSINNPNGLFVRLSRMQMILNQREARTQPAHPPIQHSYADGSFGLGKAPEALWVSKNVRIRKILSSGALRVTAPA